MEEGWRKPVTTMWHVAMIFLVWALVEDLEVVDGSSDSLEKALQAVSSYLPNKAGGMGCCWHHGVGFPDCSEG